MYIYRLLRVCCVDQLAKKKNTIYMNATRIICIRTCVQLLLVGGGVEATKKTMEEMKVAGFQFWADSLLPDVEFFLRKPTKKYYKISDFKK